MILALGGGSWQRLGSDGAWVPLLRARGVEVEPLRPSNCGFEIGGWSELFRDKFSGARSNRWPWDWRAKRRARANSS